MRGVPPEVDRLMWAVAETSGPQAIEEFCSRYPEHRGELMRRVNMVQGLRNQVKVTHQGRTEPPKFIPREPIQVPNPRAVFLAGALGFAAIAAASYTAYSAFHPAHRPTTGVVREAVPGLDAPLPVPKVVERTPVIQTPPPVDPSPPSNEPQTEPTYRKPQEKIEVKGASLLDTLTMVTAGSGMKLVIGPGFVNQQVSVAYHDISPLEAVQAMAKEYAFSIFDEGDGTFLVLPIPDKITQLPSQRPTRRIGP